MKTYTVNSKTEHGAGYSIQLVVVNDNGQPNHQESVAIQTTDKDYADTFVIGENHSVKKAK